MCVCACVRGVCVGVVCVCAWCVCGCGVCVRVCGRKFIRPKVLTVVVLVCWLSLVEDVLH